MFELPEDLFKKELREELKKINSDWKSEMFNRGLDKEYGIEQKKNYQAHIDEYNTTEKFKKERNLSDKQTASDGFTSEELKRELDLEDLQTKFLKEVDAKDGDKIKKANEFIRKKKEHWFDN